MPQHRFTLSQFYKQYPDDDTCLEVLFKQRFGHLTCCPNCGVIGAEFYRIKKRRCYACAECRHQLYPTAGTVMHRSTTSLQTWFLAIYLFSINKNGISSLELERILGVTHKTAWRIGKQIRTSMKQGTRQLTGIVEADEAYIGGRRRSSNRFSNKIPLLGVVERGGEVRVQVTDRASASTAMPFLYKNVAKDAVLHTDESKIYYRAKQTFTHHTVEHGAYEFVRGDDFTNTIEGVWGGFKPYLKGTHRAVSKRYLQLYVDERVWKYNWRHEVVLYPRLLKAVAQPVKVAAQKN